ncbi:cytochrome c oxidase subunit II [Opitutus terrae]|uniref:Cytochrome c oxidase subunit 2 n=1 Tax=Opitutus terrae (strain DSM 11246 / JCM 15787 / PB90-1) TaxID=452637 RepID=B1ZVF0_OPITP|nr:cytochrome c oxidase subunit II [Opitutus terrae]ACB76817.1 cytochrome c oxidase, subunit II [Opitutus terrae PB90-1]
MNGESGSIFNPAAPHAQAISDLFVINLWVCAVIFALVAGAVGYSLVRYRWREGDAEPVQLAGHTTVEIIWTVIPFLIVVVLFGLTVHAMQKSDPPAAPEPDLVIIGHQWWWEIRDPKLGYVAANEIHIPVGKPLSIRLDTVDVLHEFWVPRLTRKMTTVPGAGNHVWMQADQPGVYQGVCSEFCGTQHAWMRFEVIAESQADYEAWVRQQQQAAPAPPTPVAARGQQLFRELTCVNCHAIQGAGGTSNAGPDLTHLAGRRYLGAGIVPNTPENLRRWLEDPQQVKPGVLMPNFKLSERQLDELMAYLETLR